MRTNPFEPIYQVLNAGTSETTSAEMPLLIDIEITNACNFECLFCYTGTKAHKRATGFMKRELFTRIIDEIAPYNVALRFIRWGEPMLHKEFYDFMHIAKEKGIMCHMNTNGSLLDETGIQELLDMRLDSLKFSFQGTDEKTYGEMRYGQSFSALVNTVKKFSEMRGGGGYPYLHAATTITYETPAMVKSFRDLLSPYCDLVTVGHTKLSHISSAQTKLPQGAKLMLDDHKARAASAKEDYRICNEVFDKLSINWDGKVSACCQDYDDFLIVGDLTQTTIQDIWKNSEELKRYRRLLKDKRHGELPLCRECYDWMAIKKPFAENN